MNSADKLYSWFSGASKQVITFYALVFQSIKYLFLHALKGYYEELLKGRGKEEEHGWFGTSFSGSTEMLMSKTRKTGINQAH